MSEKSEKKNAWDAGSGNQCVKHEAWTRCPCHWWGKDKGIRRGLAKWAPTRIAGKEQAKAILNRFKAEIDRNGTTGKHEGVVSNAAMTVSQLVDRYEQKHVKNHTFTDKSLASALSRIRAHFCPCPQCVS